MILFCGEKVTDCFDGAVKKLGLQHHRCRSSQHQKVNPLSEKKENHQNYYGKTELVGDTEVISYCIFQT